MDQSDAGSAGMFSRWTNQTATPGAPAQERAEGSLAHCDVNNADSYRRTTVSMSGTNGCYFIG
eukprot:2910001-Pyramimonas_sp.AAC.1